MTASPDVTPLLHVVPAAAWAAETGDTLFDRDVALDGFVHCCTEAQLPGVVARYYADETDLLVVVIDPAGLGPAEVRYEGHPEAFPHVYGPVARSAVLAVRSFGRDR